MTFYRIYDRAAEPEYEFEETMSQNPEHITLREAVSIALDILNGIDGNEQVDLAQGYLSEAYEANEIPLTIGDCRFCGATNELLIDGDCADCTRTFIENGRADEEEN